MVSIQRFCAVCASVAIAASVFVGCAKTDVPPTATSAVVPTESHGHGAGAHGTPEPTIHPPEKVADDEESKLYLTPGGIYTVADIEANGNRTASQKFKSLRAEHDLKPRSGDKICPITLTKASPKFSWIVGGKTYEFCCPPCVDEFVGLAKNEPGKILAPEEYRKK